MPSIYLESTIPSYLVSRPSRDLVTAAHQQITHEWWAQARANFDIFVSEAVLEEIREGDHALAVRRLELVKSLPVLTLSTGVGDLVRHYSRRLGLPEHASTDVLHIAFAVAYRLDYLVTWNCKHIANGRVIQRLASINHEAGRPTPIIVTPEELS